jgi:hypothetical protein
MYYKVKLLNDSIDKSTAEIVPYNQMDGTVTMSVYSDNVKMKQHLERLVSTEAYILAPGRFGKNFFADGVLVVYPNTMEFLSALPEILSWKGYNCYFVNDTHKSMHLMDFGFFVTKSANDIYQNSQGERIVRRVPTGYVAVHTDGRTIAAGGWINANIDKEDADWTLVENPYETMSPDERSADKENMDMYLQEYHPGADEKVYEERKEGEYYYTDYKPTSGKRLSEVMKPREEGIVPDSPTASALSPGRVMYSPTTGYALMSENWPPALEGYEKLSWYVFDTLTIDDSEKEMYAQITGMTPQLISGLQAGLVQTEKNLDISSGFKFSLPGRGNIEINQMSPERLSLDLARTPEYMESYKVTADIMKKIKAMTSKYNEVTGKHEVSKEAAKIQLDDLNGLYANFVMEPFDYQRPGIMALIEESQYEAFGGPKGWHGHFLNFTYGLGKTAIVTAADAIMRNRGKFKVGEQVTIVTAPNKNVYVWQSEIAKFRNENAIVIDGDRETRTAQWEDLIRKAQTGSLPNMIVLGSSKFRYTSGEEEDLLGLDAQYMKLLALGGSYRDEPVKGGHVSALVVDESGQYVNPGSSRHAAVQEIIESIYQGSGLTWTLNGDISGNSASDTVSEVSFINKMVRDNYNAVVHEYTKKDHDAQQTRASKELGRRIWKDVRRMNDFASTFRPQIYTLNGQTIAGDKYGLNRTTDVGSELGHTWGKVYMAAERKLEALADAKKMRKALGLMSVLTQASLGAVSPARIIEYDLGTRELMNSVAKLLKPEDYVKFREELMTFRDQVTEDTFGIGILPKSGDVSERNSVYNSVFSETSKSAMDRAVFSWDAPILDSIVDGIDLEIRNQTPGEPPKVGVAGFSKVAMNAVYRKLLEKYGDRVVIQIIDGDTPAEEVSVKQKRHQTEAGRPVITIVTSAGLYGLSLPSTRSFRLATWNSAKAGQYEGRFHRSPEQENLVTVAVPDGICQYMREVEQKKRKMELETRGAVLSPNSEEEDDIDEKEAMSFLKRMAQYRPRIRQEEAGRL